MTGKYYYYYYYYYNYEGHNAVVVHLLYHFICCWICVRVFVARVRAHLRL